MFQTLTVDFVGVDHRLRGVLMAKSRARRGARLDVVAGGPALDFGGGEATKSIDVGSY